MYNMTHNLWFILMCCLSLCFHVSSGASSISSNYSLSGDETIVSAKNIFELGFFQPGNSSKFYIGIWYKIVSKPTYVWVANRQKHVSDKYSSVLKISQGNLVLLDESGSEVWSTNLNSTSASEAFLKDDGNFVLRDTTTQLWQSFDFPSDTWLPGSKVGLNNRTGENTRLTSWTNSENPAPGPFSLELDPNGSNSYIILWNRSKSYWSSGSWNDKSLIFSDVPEMRLSYIYNYTYVTNENESYFTYSVYKSAFTSRFFIDVSGQIKQHTWMETTKVWNLFWFQPRQQCEVYSLCGSFGSCNEKSLPFCTCLEGFEPSSQKDWDLNDFSGGCKRKTRLNCGNATTLPSDWGSDKFSFNANIKLPEDPQSVTASNRVECESTCFRKCTCVAYAYESNQCSIWNQSLINLQKLSEDNNEGKTLYLRIAAADFTTESPRGKISKGMLVGVVVGSLGIVALLVCVLGVMLRQRRIAKTSKAVEGTLVAYTYRDLASATKNFSEKLGGGGFGSVFKGALSDSSAIAVKRLESISQGEKQFRSEVSTIGTIQHVNLVRLRGFCSEGTKRLLVYDHMPNGSLDSNLFHGTMLSWKARHEIAVGTARGLVYLHEKCRDCIIHCDIKPENILLDAELCPKVADFGLAKLVGRDFSRVLTTMRGTRGYLAPEWISGVAITSKADVYSYGMMLFEIVSGRRNSQQLEDGKINFFPNWAAKVLSQGGDVLSLLDPRLGGDADVEEVFRICKVACWCIQDEESHRPSMSQVVQILDGVLDVNLPPIPRSLQVFVEDQEGIIFFTESCTSSSQAASSTTATSTATKSTTSSAS